MMYGTMVSKSAFLLRSLRIRNFCSTGRKFASLLNTNQAKVKIGIENLQLGSEHHGFKIESIEEVDDFALTTVGLTHMKTGARYLHVSKEDENNVFCIGFRTTPQDSTGVSHILEHTVLCGSKLYPCRDPFFRMLNRSLATFMNAMTGPDYTIYPFSTQNEKDFQNLLSVYMDAVFYPHLNELDFLQEGWRLEHKDPENPETPLEFKGVVFNEMKGAFSDSGSVLGQHLMNKLLPSNTYGYVSGGDPPKILNLTWEQLKNFHANHYHPSNSRIFTYGNMSLLNHLKLIHENYLSHFDRIKPSQEVPNEPRWIEPRRTEITCRPDPFAPNPEKQSTAVISYLLSDIVDPYETFVLQVVSELLTSGPNAPFYKNLLEPNIGMGFSPVSGFDGHTRDTSFTIGLQGIHSNDIESVLNTIRATFTEVAEKGFTAEQVEGVLHSVELAIKSQSTNFGLSTIMGLTPIWNHSGDPVEALRINSKIDRFRRHLQEEPSYLQDKIRFYFINNPHQLVTVMSPDPEYEEKTERQEKTILEEKCNALTDHDRELIFNKGKALAELQQKSNDFSCLPTLQLSDIKSDVEQVHLLHETVTDIPLQMCVQPTNDITYFRSVINASHLPDELKANLPLFCLVATKMGTNDYDYRQLDQQIKLKTGGLSVGMHLAEGIDSPLVYEQGIVLSSFCLNRNLQEMFKLWESVFTRLLFDDQSRFETLLRNTAGDLVNGLTHMGHQYAMTSAASSLTPAARIKEQVSGMTFIKHMKSLTEDEQRGPILQSLREIARQLLRKDVMRCSINTTSNAQDAAAKQLENLLNIVPGSPQTSSHRIWNHISDFQPQLRRVHHVLPVPINFTSKVLPGVPFRSPDYAPLRILASLMTSKFLHPEIREKGGAYGSGAVASPAGHFSFYSYRDPKSLETIDVFDRAVNWAIDAQYDEEAIKEAKLSVFQRVDAPTPPSSKGMRLFLNGISDEHFRIHRQQLLDASRDDLVRVAKAYLQNDSICGVTLIGPPNEVVSNNANWNVQTQ